MSIFSNISFGQYVPVNSFIHRLDPRGKIIALFLLMVGVFLTVRLDFFISWGILLLTLILLSKLSVRFVWKGLKPVIFLVVFAFVLNLFLTPGKVIWQWRFLKVTEEGLSMGTLITLRIFFLVAFASLLTLTTSPTELTSGIEYLLSLVPYVRRNAQDIAMMMSIAIRFIPTLAQETDKIIKAQMARGMNFESGNVVRRMKNYIPVLVPLFVGAFRRADELAIAMESRCYGSASKRSKLNELRFGFKDVMFVVSITTYTASVIVLSRFLSIGFLN